MYTVGAAYAAKSEHVLGRIEDDYAGDLVLADSKILNAAENKECAQFLRSYSPEAVIVGGEVVFSKTEFRTKSNVFQFSDDSSARSKFLHRGLLIERESASTAKGVSMGGPFIPGKNGPLKLCRPAGFCACILKFGAFAGACAPRNGVSSTDYDYKRTDEAIDVNVSES